MIKKSTRGSEWRKWDMHLHSYFTYLNNNFSDISKEEYIEKIVDSDIKVVGLTNYFNFRNEDYELKKDLEEKGIIVFLNLELRLAYQNKDDDCCDFHIIFDNSLQEEQIKMLLSNLDVTLNGQTRKACLLESKSELENSVVELDTLIETLENASLNLKNKYLLGFLSRGKGNSRTSSVYAKIYEKTDFIIHSSDSEENLLHDREFWLQYKRPLLQSSDAHAENQIGNKFSWIKADTTFEGLKQIIYEPESRISLQIDKPEFKNDYQIIDSIEFNNNAMGTQKIEFNQNLNTVIGGRSSGKSILLGCLANIIDPSQKPKENQDAYNENIRKLIKDASVLWRDGSSETRKIIYYSQSKISEIVRPDENGISGINKLVNRIVRTDENKVELLQAYDKAVIANRTELISKINDFCEIKKQIQEKNDEIRDIGIKKGIQQEIEKLEKEIDSIKKELKDYLSASDEQLYKEKVEKLEKLQECRKLLTSDTAQYDIAENSELFTSLDSLLSSFSSLNHDEISDFYESLKKETKEKWVDFIKKQKKDIFEKMNKVDEKIKEITDSEIFIKGNSFKDNNEVLSKKDSDLQKEKQKNNTIEKIESEISKLQESLNNCKNDIFVSFSKYKTLANELSEKLQMQKKGVEIKANVHLLYKDFFKLVLESINRTRKENQKYEDYETISPSSREELISNLFYGIINDEIILKKQFHQVLTDLFSNNYYTISYDVTYDNDSFEKMSEGKKAFIVLRLLLDFDDSVCPIIIDQPEDDLDNRAIYDQLVKYLKEQKKERQIILATHNPNVVVGADAELVIVANQNGIDSPNQDNLQFEYYGNSIEDTFENRECNTVLLSKGIREHICEILEGGTAAFQIREKKYGYNVN